MPRSAGAAGGYVPGEEIIPHRHLNLAVQTALERGHSEVRAVRNDREYQFDISRITVDGLIPAAPPLYG